MSPAQSSYKKKRVRRYPIQKLYEGSGLGRFRSTITRLQRAADSKGRIRDREYVLPDQAHEKVLDYLEKKLQGEDTQLVLDEVHKVCAEYRETLGALSRGSRSFVCWKKIGEYHRAMWARLGKFDDLSCASLASKHAWDASVAYERAYVFGKRHSPPTDPVVLGLCNSLAMITWDLLRDKHRSCAILEGAIKEVAPDMIPHLSDESRSAFQSLQKTLQAMKREEPHWTLITSATVCSKI